MILTDAGPLIALVVRRDPNHLACSAAVPTLSLPMITILPALTEAMHVCFREGGWPAQEAVWQMLDRQALVLADLEPPDLARVRELMQQYRDTPMDFADATLVAYAERQNLTEIFTLDRRGFSTYRLRGRARFVVYP